MGISNSLGDSLQAALKYIGQIVGTISMPQCIDYQLWKDQGTAVCKNLAEQQFRETCQTQMKTPGTLVAIQTAINHSVQDILHVSVTVCKRSQ